jgi:hypothetical protein
METPPVANHPVTPVFSDHQEGLLPSQIFSAPTEAPIAIRHLEVPVFKDLRADQVVLSPDQAPVRADHLVAPAQGNQAVQTVEEDIDLPLFFRVCIKAV